MIQQEQLKVQHELFKYINYSIRRLTEKQRAVAIDIITQEFGDQQPLSNAYCRLYPQTKQNIYKTWKTIYSPFIQDAVANQTSVIALDLNNNQVVAVSASGCINFDCHEFYEKIIQTPSFGNPIIKVEESLYQYVKAEYRTLLKQKGKLLDIWGVAIKKNHMGKRLLHQMMKGNEILGKRKGFEYGFSYVVNFKTGVALRKINYEKIAELDARQFIFEGKKVFSQIEEINRYPSFWLKKFE